MIELEGMFETDWLASVPVFYNENTCKISHNINDVIDYNNIELDPEGLCNYLDFGYSVFGQTPVKGVKFLNHSSRISIQNSTIIVEKKDDIAERFLSNYTSSSPKDVLELIHSEINDKVRKCSGDIIVPISGGYDSRLIVSFIEDKKRVRAYTYGLSPDQSKSSETVYAKYICEKLGIRWKQVELGEYNKNLDFWISEFGVSACANGNYQTEFLEAISKETFNKENSLYISGIIGDAWAGSIKRFNVDFTPQNIYKLGYTHGMRVDSDFCKLKKNNEHSLAYNFIKDNEGKIDDERWQIILAMRLKMVLLSFLIKLPTIYGINSVYSPFLNEEIALKMLTLESQYRNNRLWQKEYFEKRGLMPENEGFRVQRVNTLHYQALKKIKLEPLNKALLGEYMDEKYLDWVNENFHKDFSNSFYERLLHTYSGHAVLKLLRMDDEGHSLRPYSAYLVLRPLQKLLELRR